MTMKANGKSAAMDADLDSHLQQIEAKYTGPVCCKCSAPDEGFAVCRVCGYYAMLGKFVEIDYEMEGLAAPPVSPGFVLPAWVSTSIVVNIIVLAESVAAALFLPLDSWERMGWSLLHLIGGAMIVLAFQFRGTVLAIMDDTSVTAIDCIVWPPRAWEALAERLPHSSRHFVWATVGLMGILMSLLVIRSVPYSSPFAIDEAPAPKRKSVFAQAINQVIPNAVGNDTFCESLLAAGDGAGAISLQYHY